MFIHRIGRKIFGLVALLRETGFSLFRSTIVFAAVLLGAGTLHADIIGPTDGRVVIPEDSFPYVGELSWIDEAGNALIYGNAWQALHPRVVITAAHLLSNDGQWVSCNSGRLPTAEQLSRYQVRFAGCSEPVALNRIVGFGKVAGPFGDAGNDWVVGLLAEDSCLRPDQLGSAAVLGEGGVDFYFLPGGPNEFGISMVSFIDRDSIGRTASNEGEQETGACWPADRSVMVESKGHITKNLFYSMDAQGVVSEAPPRQRHLPEVSNTWVHTADTDEGNSGGIIHLRGQLSHNGRTHILDYVVGMTVAEDSTPGVTRNFLMPITEELWDTMQRAASIAISVDQ